jgi:hypothetical protein
MTRFSFKSLTTLAAAAAIALTSLTATPAAALSNKDRNALGIVLGIGTMALIIDGIEKDKKQVRRTERYEERYQDRYQDRWDGDRREVRRDARHMLPAQCLTRVETRGRSREVISGRCVARNTSRVNLPQACAFDIRTDRNRREEVFGRNCLESHGYRISRR